MTFEDWKTGFLTAAEGQGFSSDFLSNISPALYHIAAPEKADTSQPEARKTLRQYLEVGVSASRINAGRAALVTHRATFDRVEDAYGVDRHIVAAIWGMETNFGKIRGDLNVIAALASRASPCLV